MKSLRIGCHPEKTWLGKVQRGFDFLGFRISSTTIQPSMQSVSRRDKKLAQLYEQGADQKRIGQYLRRWSGRACMGILCAVGGDAIATSRSDYGYFTYLADVCVNNSVGYHTIFNIHIEPTDIQYAYKMISFDYNIPAEDLINTGDCHYSMTLSIQDNGGFVSDINGAASQTWDIPVTATGVIQHTVSNVHIHFMSGVVPADGDIATFALTLTGTPD